MNIGINLFGILRDLKRPEDAAAALKSLKAAGFRFVEPCIAPGPIAGWDHVFWPADRLPDWFRMIREAGLEVFSAHLSGWNPAADRERLKDIAVNLGLRQLVLKCPETLTELSLHQASMAYMRLADTLREADIELLLHNERPDIAARIGGKSAYEHLLSLCLGKVGAQVDAGWALAGGEDPEALLWRLGSRVRSLHYKEIRLGGGEASAVPLGSGNVDLTACFQFARAMGIPQLIDQDAFSDAPGDSPADGLRLLASLVQARVPSVSYLNTLDVETGEVRTLRRFDRVIEAPNWLKGRDCFLYNSEGHIWIYDPRTDTETMVDSGECDNCNNDHVLSPDEQTVAVSHASSGWKVPSRIYTLPVGGGVPKLITPVGPSYLHGWSPDGRELAYCAFREHGGKLEVDIYTIPADGGEETRLTAGGFNDGPEYSPDGKFIWFNSTRSGLMQIWRMARDGSGQRQMSFDESNNWFAHLSPDGEKVAYLSYRKGDLDPNEHLPNMQVQLRMMNADGTGDRLLLSFFGGQGSLNVNSWAADSRRLAFVSYEILHK